jgi:DNA ligase-1
VKIQAGIPVASMSCEREKTFEKILERMGTAIIQPKYDGLRCQIHYSKDGFKDEIKLPKKQEEFFSKKNSNVRLFSRNLESLTDMFPDIAKSLEKFKVKSAILDTEVIGINEKTGEFLPFQETIQRKRKYDVKEVSKSVPVKFFTFDLLYLNGKDLSQLKLGERINKLKSSVENAQQDRIKLTPSDSVNKLEPFQKLFDKYVEDGLEGIIAKDTDSTYQPGKRGYDWIKLKKSSQGHLADNIDTVVLGYYKGRGARAKFGIGAILVGVLNKKNNKFESIAKVGTGIKDDDWKVIKNKLEDLMIECCPENVSVVKNLEPDIWVKPEVVMVVDADEVTTSPSHMAGFKDGRGYSLRFPRLKEFDRKDKGAEDVTTVREIEKLYKMQKN